MRRIYVSGTINIGTRHEINDIPSYSKYSIAIEIKWKYTCGGILKVNSGRIFGGQIVKILGVIKKNLYFIKFFPESVN